MTGLDRLEARLRAHPEPVAGRSLGIGEFLIGVASGFYATSEWPGLRQALAGAERGNGAGMLHYADDLLERHSNGYTNLMESNTAINCIDRESPRSVDSFDSLAARPESVRIRGAPSLRRRRARVTSKAISRLNAGVAADPPSSCSATPKRSRSSAGR